jgi:pyrroline-5-carboxylate reductase
MTVVLSPETPLLLFGCGNMGRAMLDGWLRAGLDPTCFVVVDPFARDLPSGVRHVEDSNTLKLQFGTAVLAIKPQLFQEAAGNIGLLLKPDALVFSILAGTRLATLESAFPERNIIRLMPNLAAAIGKSPLGMFTSASLDRSAIDQLVNPLGTAFWLANEDQMDAVTALAGSGPAFVYRFIDALAHAGGELGLDAETALGLATSMVEGAALLAANSGENPEELARRVTSPGGTTAAGLSVLDDADALRKLVLKTLTAARDRGAELAKS